MENNGMIGNGANDTEVTDVAAFVQSLLKDMQTRFQTMSDSVIHRIDDMGARVNDLEKSITDLLEQAGAEDARGRK